MLNRKFADARDYLPSNRWVVSSLLIISVCSILLSGCNSSSGGYPEVKVTTAIGFSQQCHQCGKTIDKVTEEHLLNAGSAQYIVCAQACRQKQMKWHESQFGK